MSTAPPELDEIRRKMAQIRRDLHEDVKGVVQGAEAATDWRRYIKSYPWASMGVALAVGYLIVPRKHRPASTSTTIHVASPEVARAVAPAEEPRPAPAKTGKGWLGTIFGLVAPVAFRAAQGYALQFAEQWMAQKVAQQMEQHPELAAAFGGQQASSPPGPRVGPPGAPRF